MAHRWSHYLKRYVKILCIAYILAQTAFSLYEIVWDNPTIQLTTIEKDLNKKIYHPLYTFCPIFDKSADVMAENATLRSVMLENGFKKPPVFFIGLQNTVEEKPRTYSTWLKTLSADKLRNINLVHCITYEFKDSIVPGEHGSQVRSNIDIPGLPIIATIFRSRSSCLIFDQIYFLGLTLKSTICTSTKNLDT